MQIFAYTAFLAGFLIAMLIAGMAIGKYYSQTKTSSLHRRKEMPPVDYLDEEKQALVSHIYQAVLLGIYEIFIYLLILSTKSVVNTW